MLAQLQSAWKSNRHWLAAGFLIASTLYLLLWFVSYQGAHRGIAASRGAGLGAASGEIGWDPISLWKQRSLVPSLPHHYTPEKRVYYQRGMSYIGGTVGGVPGGVAHTMALNAPPADHSSRREVMRTGSLMIVVPNAARASEQVRDISTRLAGFVVKSSINGSEQSARSAEVVVRVPAVEFENARREIRRLATSIDDDTTEASDVTRESTDQQATLRNYRAEEEQYLAIMKRATSVKDVLEVSEKLAEVRGRIERLVTEIRDLHQQVDMSLLTVAIRSAAEAQVFGLNWRPLYQAKLSARQALGALADFTDSVVALVFYVPVILLWGLLVLLVAKLGWMTLSRVVRRLFPGLPLWRPIATEARPETATR